MRKTMKRIMVFLLVITSLLMMGGCAKGTSTSDAETDQDYDQFTSQFRDSYAKCTFTLAYIDAEEMAEDIKPDLHEYDDITEVFLDEAQGYCRKYFEDKETVYGWSQHGDGSAGINFYGPLSSEEYEESLQKVREYMNSLPFEVEIYSLHEAEGVSEGRYRQVLDGIPVSAHQSVIPSLIIADVGMATGIQIELWEVIDEIHEIAAYETEDFLPLNVVNSILEQYLEHQMEVFGQSADMTTTIEDVEIVYYVVQEGGTYVLTPAYEVDVQEDNGKVKYQATYIVDVLSGYVYNREGDRFW